MSKLFDQYGRPIETSRRPQLDQVAIALVRDKFADYPSRGLTPAKLTSILEEADEGETERAAELGMEMEEKDGHLASILGTRKLAVAGLPFSIQAASDDPEDVKDKEVAERALAQVNVSELILDLMDAVGKGFSICEIQWAIGDEVLPRSIDWVDAKNFTWDRRIPRLVTQAEPTKGELLPANKFLIHTYKARSGLPCRGGLLRVVSWMYLFKNFSLKDWMAYAEVFGIPLRLGEYDPGASKEDKDALAAALMQIASDAAGLIPTNTKINFVETKGTGSSDNVFQALIEYCDRTMSKTILGQTLTSDTTGGTGTLAAGKVHNEVREDLRDADAAAIERTIQRDLFAPVVGFNRGWDRVKRLPKFKLNVSKPEDRKALADTYGVLAKDVGLEIPTAFLYEKFGIPAPKEGESVATGPVQAAPPAPQAMKLWLPAGALALRAGFTADQQGLEVLGDAAIAEAAPVIDDLATPILDAVKAATSYDDLRARLETLSSGLDPGALEDLVARTWFMSAMAGRAHA